MCVTGRNHRLVLEDTELLVTLWNVWRAGQVLPVLSQTSSSKTPPPGTPDASLVPPAPAAPKSRSRDRAPQRGKGQGYRA